MAHEVYREVDGFYISSGFHDKCVRSALSYKPVPGDMFIVSYPKCGTTWMQHIVYNVLNGHPPPRDPIRAAMAMPFLEMQGAESLKDMPKPGAIKTHMPFNFQPFSEQAKYIYICRNPYDCCVSFFYHTRDMPEYRFQDGTFDQFFDMFLEGKVDFGDYFDHVLSWYHHRADPNVLFLAYEDLKKDTSAWVLKIADFLGEEYGRKLREDPAALGTVLDNISIKKMKENVNDGMKNFFESAQSMPDKDKPEWVRLTLEAMGDAMGPMVGEFVRKGAVGDWRNHFSEDQVKRMKEQIAVKTRGSDVMELWRDLQLP